MTPPGEFPNNSAQPHLALWLDSPVVQSGPALRLDLRDLRKAHFLKPIRNGFRPRVYLVLAYARHSTVASPLSPAAAGLLITLIAVGPRQKDAHGLITEPSDMVVYCAGFPGNLRRQPLYFQDPTFAARPSPLIPSTWVLRSAFRRAPYLGDRKDSCVNE